jgi:hypothetical protein
MGNRGRKRPGASGLIHAQEIAGDDFMSEDFPSLGVGFEPSPEGFPSPGLDSQK